MKQTLMTQSLLLLLVIYSDVFLILSLFLLLKNADCDPLN